MRKSVGKVGADTSEAVKAAVGGAMDAATSIGGDGAQKVRDALLSATALPRDVIESVLKGDNK